MSKPPAADTPPSFVPPSTILTPASTPSDTPKRHSALLSISALHSQQEMDEAQIKAAEVAAPIKDDLEQPVAAKGDIAAQAALKKKTKCAKSHHHKKTAKSKKNKSSKSAKKSKSTLKNSASDDDCYGTSSFASSSSSSEDESEESSSSEEEVKKKKTKSKAKEVKKCKDKKRKKSKKQESSSESEDDSSDDSESSSDEEVTKKKKKKSGKKAASSSESDESSEIDVEDLETQVQELSTKLAALKATKSKSSQRRKSSSSKSSKSSKTKSSSKRYRRVDQLWDSEIHNYKLKESAEDEEGEFSEYAFLVRRTFNWENKYQDTVIDIKSKALREVLTEVMKDCKSVSLETVEPVIDPKILFLYIEDLRAHYKKTLSAKIKSEKKKKQVKKLNEQRRLCKTLVEYLDEDYAETKKTLYPLLAAGNITFDLVWALFKPNEIAITSCYGSWDEPRCFQVEYAEHNCSMTRGEWYEITGRYVEYDGKSFGFSDFQVDQESFKGPRKISSLAVYPLKYHRDQAAVKKQLIARGRRFVEMKGIQYKFHKGMAFHKKKKQVLKININGRIMVDAAIFRRINPNYPISAVKTKEWDDLFSDSDDDEADCCCGDSDDEDAVDEGFGIRKDDDSGPKFKYKWENDKDGEEHLVAVEVDSDGDPVHVEPAVAPLEAISSKRRSYTDEELLLTSPVVLGFSFNEKLWLEFSLSGLKDITYNDQAFDSLVLPGDQKSTVRALVESHKFHAARTIDDVVQGKGRGLVFVLHGPPGTGKTLTAEGISELLRVPLYIVSAGELGTEPARLETELQKILDIAHSWGALLLLDEADVFLEKREVHDIHRNALVSIFLRLLEYFQGILFLTTNRVETFDDAFQSRIHVALRYDELTTAAKKEVWKNFLGMVETQQALPTPSTSTTGALTTKQVELRNQPLFTDKDFAALARHSLNGRQIKNLVRTAQALALNEGSELTMGHLRRVMDVAETFERDLRGGIGYEEAMRTYT